MGKTMLSQVNGPAGRRRWFAPDFVSFGWQIAAVGAASVVGLAIRLYQLAAEPLSSQEIYTWDFAHQTVPFILGKLTHIETNPPFYYLLMKLVMRIGETEFLLRLPSVVAGTMAIPLVYALGRLGGAPRSGVIGAALVSLSAIAISYSREARTYALLQDACLFAAIGAVLIITHHVSRYARDASQSSRTGRRAILGWVLFTLASILGFYLHYTFAFEILVLECAIAVAVGTGWLAGTTRIDATLVLRWLASSLAIVLGVAWGFSLAQSQSHSDNIAWMQVPSLREALRLLIHVDGYTNVFRFQPLPSLVFIGLAVIGLLAGWRRSAAVLVCGALFALFPAVLFVVSQRRPVFIERSLVAPSFAACLLAAHGALFLVQKLSAAGAELIRGNRAWGPRYAPYLPGALTIGAMVVLFAPALISAGNSVRVGPVWEPYDKVAAYLSSVVKPGDAAAGTDGIIYYRRRDKADFPYFKLVAGSSSEAQVTYGSPTTRPEQIPELAGAGRSVYLVLRESINLVVDGQFHESYANYVLGKVGHHSPPVASFGSLGVYRLPGKCVGPAPCLAAQPQGNPGPVQDP